MADRVNRYEHCDYAAAELDPPHVDSNGFVLAATRMARIGVQEYQDSRGGIRREYRSPEEVMKSLDSFKNLPVTSAHPPEMVTPENVKQYAIGAVGEDLKFDGKWIVGKVKVWSKQGQMDAKDRPSVSCGYSCELDMTPGVSPDGESYDCSQKNITGNHFAVAVDAGRAGPLAVARLDANDAIAILAVPASKVLTVKNKETRQMAQIKVDGLIFEVSDPNMQAVIDKTLAAAKKDGEEKAAAEKQRADAAEKQRDASYKARDEEKSRADALEAKLRADADKMVKCDECGGAGLKECKGCEGKGEFPAKMDTAERRAAVIERLVEKRAAVRADARAKLRQVVLRVFGRNEKLDGVSDRDLKTKVIAKNLPSYKLEGRSDQEIETAYEIAVADFERVTQVDDIRPAAPALSLVQPKTDDRPSNADDARRRSDAMFLGQHYKAKK